MELLGFLRFYANHGSLSSGFCPPPRDGLLQTIKLTQNVFTNELPYFLQYTSSDHHENSFEFEEWEKMKDNKGVVGIQGPYYEGTG
ncbi:hypothetical protein QYF36_014142 [Acer negundo]|nr:hypothetical protein QYF36_014142 [Acer negundo]